MSRQIAPFGLRMPPEIREQIEEAAAANRRSVNAEIVSRLQQTERPASAEPSRALIAAMALQGLCADPTNHKIFGSPEEAAANAVYIADALLAELAKEPQA